MRNALEMESVAHAYEVLARIGMLNARVGDVLDLQLDFVAAAFAKAVAQPQMGGKIQIRAEFLARRAIAVGHADDAQTCLPEPWGLASVTAPAQGGHHADHPAVVAAVDAVKAKPARVNVPMTAHFAAP